MPPENVLGKDNRPRFFAVGNAAELGLEPSAPRHGLALRAFVRSLAGMQKEAVVVSSEAGSAWRLVSDEGPYLAGHDEAPFPLAFMSAGMAASFFTEISALAGQRGLDTRDLRLTLDNRYTMEGSALRGTMVGGALPPAVRVTTDGDDARLASICADALAASPLHGLLRGAHNSLFTLTSNGSPVKLGRVAALDASALPDPAEQIGRITVAGPNDAAALMTKSATAELHEGEGGKGSSLQAEQKRTLHVRATCILRPDGVKDIEINLIKPSGSSFHFRSEEPSDGRAGRAPDAATLVSAGIAFCFLTQFGRYAAITQKQLDGYRIVQNTQFSPGGASRGTGQAGQADPVETHVHLDTAEDDDFARTLVDIGEQTCFLHALCRTPLRPVLTL
jgi:hypothetical protein